MSGGHEIALAYQWVASVLSGDGTLTSLATGGIRRSLAPPGTATPYVILGLMSGTDVTTANAFRLMSNLLFQVKAVGPASSMQPIVDTASRIDVLLGGPRSGAVSGAYILTCYRDGALAMDELVNGELWSNIGGMYRMEIEQTS